ncbi:MAG TPA: hypothetical protein VMW16_00035 [Sedimentisphaerales bacterium]|nr:hypothetical protein [Sedimentisphaerales bacterium]
MKINAKKCSKCGKIKAVYDFYAHTQHSDRLRSECKACGAEYTKIYRVKPKVQAIQKAQSRKRNERNKQHNKTERDSLKTEVFSAYGGKCVCCGENNLMFLSIDHINGQGTRHRRQIGGSSNLLYRWLRKNNYPKGFQVLCFNCNRGKYFNNGICPHNCAALIAEELAKK